MADTAHPELAGLLAGLVHEPGDDARWLVVADWLEENGYAQQAELMRLVRRLRGMPVGPERLALESRAWGLLAEGVHPCVPTVTNSLGMALVLIPAGAFLMGSPEDEEGRYEDEQQREVIIPAPFFLGRTAVTQQQYFQVTGKRPSAFKSTGRMKARVGAMDTSNLPVERVTWHEAVEFCRLLGELPEEKAAGRVYRLPTEAEWEYACRGEASHMAPYPHGRKVSTKLVNYRSGRRPRGSPGRPVEVGSLPPNAFGLHEMTGNIWEWCADQHDTGHGPDGNRNARGGTFDQAANRARTADRSSFAPDHRDHDLGLRVLLQWRAPGE